MLASAARLIIGDWVREGIAEDVVEAGADVKASFPALLLFVTILVQYLLNS